MFSIEGIKIKAKTIPNNKLFETWKRLTDKPYPKIKALMLNDHDFDHIIQHRRSPEDDLREIEEWGRLLPTKGTDACVFNADQSADEQYVILVRKTPFHSLDEIIRHELLHIVHGDL